MRKFYINTFEEIPDLIGKITKKINEKTVLGLIGSLGSGKTTFVKALAKSLGIKSKITSPTFSLMNRYPFFLKGKKVYFYHLDIFRTKNFTEVKALGINELWQRPGSIVVIEWADKIIKKLPPKTVLIYFKT